MDLDTTTILSRGLEAIVLFTASALGAWAHKLISMIYKNQRDMNALWPRVRDLEAIIKGELDGTVSGHRLEAADEVPDAASGGKSGDRSSLGAGEKNQANG